MKIDYKYIAQSTLDRSTAFIIKLFIYVDSLYCIYEQLNGVHKWIFTQSVSFETFELFINAHMKKQLAHVYNGLDSFSLFSFC